MGALDEMLDRVKVDDLEKFKKVVEKKEMRSNQWKLEQGYQNIDDILKMSSTPVETELSEKPDIAEPVEDNTTDKETQDIFAKFMNKIKG